MRKENKGSGFSFIIVFFVIVIFGSILSTVFESFSSNNYNYHGDKYTYDDKVFSIITTPENRVIENTIREYASKNEFDVHIEYADNLEIVEKLNSGEKYDAIWASNSIWLDLLDSSVSTSNLKSTSISPIVFGIKKSLAESLNLVGRDVTMNDLLNLIKNGKLNFSMANPITTNSGASAYFNILSTLAGNPEVLTLDHLKNKGLVTNLKTFFSGLERTSGDEDFLEESFINGDYDAAVSYESSIININKRLEEQGKEILYLIYPVDGVSISDSPLVYINNGNEAKKERFLEFQSYILSDDGQKVLASLGRRTWYGGVTDKADKNLFKKEWGIDTTKYISSVKYPSKAVIREALKLYQEEFRKPVHVVFCLDYSGSMYGDGFSSLMKALEFILGKEASNYFIQFSKYDKVDFLVFSDTVRRIQYEYGNDFTEVLDKLRHVETSGSTALYPSVINALTILKNESNEYNLSIILMTDGAGNVGTYNAVHETYSGIGREIPIYSITFAAASEEQLNSLANLSNGKVFDGRENLVNAFKMVRGYN